MRWHHRQRSRKKEEHPFPVEVERVQHRTKLMVAMRLIEEVIRDSYHTLPEPVAEELVEVYNKLLYTANEELFPT
jgi:hypothetical protein